MKRRLLFLISLVCLICTLSCTKTKVETKYVASTSWVAAIAEVAGVDDIRSIAPANLRHPPEYEITPEDILAVSKAELFLNAGYEAMMKVIADAAEVDKEKVVKVRTDNSIENIGNMVKLIAEKAGTQEKAEKRYAEYKKLIEDSAKKIADNNKNTIPVIVHKDQMPLAKSLNLNIAGTIGSAPLTSDQIADIAQNKYAVIIDNLHNPVADPAKEVSPDSVIVVWRNFPDHTGKNALYELVKENIKALYKAFGL